MIVTNYRFNTNVCGHYFAGDTNPMWVITPHTMRGYFGPAQTETTIEQNKRDSFPTGTNPPYSIVLGDKGALLSSTTTVNGTGVVVAGLAMGKACEASLSGSCSITAALSLITSMNAALAGSGTLTAALVGSVVLNAALTGTSSVTAGLGLISNLIAALNGSGTLTADLKGTVSMSATIYVNESEFTVTQLVDAMWNALADDYNNPDTMGELLNGAGGGSTPSAIADAVWDEVLSAHSISGSTGEKLSKLLEKIQFLYLK